MVNKLKITVVVQGAIATSHLLFKLPIPSDVSSAAAEACSRSAHTRRNRLPCCSRDEPSFGQQGPRYQLPFALRPEHYLTGCAELFRDGDTDVSRFPAHQAMTRRACRGIIVA